MSKLEQVARAKALAAQQSRQSETTDSESTLSRSVSLLSKLQKSKATSEEKPKPSLSDRLKTLKINNSQVLNSEADKKTLGRADGKSSLSSKLQALRNRHAPPEAVQPEKTNANDKNGVRSAEKSTVKDTALRNLWERLCMQEVHQEIENDRKLISTNLSAISKTVAKPSYEDEKTTTLRRKRYKDIFTVFYPRKKHRTNSVETAQQKAACNFTKPSPDDVVLNAQENVFSGVKDGVSKLKLNDKEQTAAGVVDDDDDKKNKEDDEMPRHYKKLTTPTKPRDPIDIDSYVKNIKPRCSFVVLGHVDAGKSTLMGRVLYDVGAVDISHIRKLKKESERIGKGSFHLAWVMDQTAEERERGVTVSICTSDFETEAAKFTIVDAPGHRDFVPNAIAGISQADVAVLSIDCGTDAFESGFNLDGQTKEHTLLARSMGVSRLVVAMNKMDTVAWDRTRFDQIRDELGSFFHDIGLKQEHIFWVPCSGLSGEGVYKTGYPNNQTWYKGPTLVKQLENVAEEITDSFKQDVIGSKFLISILEVIPSSKNEEVSITGKVESGSIQPGESITLYPSGQGVLVDKILTADEKVTCRIAIKGDFVTLKLRNAHPEDIEAGDLGASIGYELEALNKFTVQLLTFSMDRPLLPGTPFILFRGVSQQPARISKLESLVSKNDPNQVLKKKVKHLGSNKAAIVEIELMDRKRWFPILTSNQSKKLGRVLLRKDGRTIAAGAVVH